ncbi:DUF4271 domain-containing protein [Dysgonomonas sp. Marseille-P4677]|nr:DUF4271 domain-containing protein [Dysgonomonas sp. Marseille-P4677]
MVKDSISYISNIGQDSIDYKDSIQQSPFSIGIIKGEINGLVDRQTINNTYTLDDSSKKDFRHEGVRHPFAIEQSDSIFGLLLLCFVLFAHLYHGGFAHLKENISILFSSDKNKRIYGQTTAKEIIYSYFLIFQTVVLSSVCIYNIFIQLDTFSEGNGNPLVSIFSFILFICLFLGIKDFIYILFGYIFDMDREMKGWRRTYITAIEILGMLYFIPTLFLVYADYFHLQIVIFMLILFLIVQLILFYQIIVFFIREKFNFLYLIAYLCTFEILPYIFLIIGLAYLYKIDVFNIL